MNKDKRRPLIAGNWKMNETYAESTVLAQQISNLCYKDWFDVVDIAVCPPYIDLKPVLSVFEFDKMKVAVGAQNCFYEKSGAYTGEVSYTMISDLGCTYCIVGHSERREIFHETNEDVNKKVLALVSETLNQVHPIICVGESLAVREEGTYLDYVDKQVRAAFAGVEAIEAKDCVVAYEPIWAIGTGRASTPEQAEEVCSAIRSTIADIYDEEIALGMRILYGGSMNEGNAELLLAQENIDGGLIGGASLKAQSFINIVKAAM